ncbi:hypothetical protein HDU93_006734 [Gonapodya sp. JEL0774]|nr:hypothetical protein HDU93_006734 [Gonapodya sp. JEL0774]
MPCLKLHMRGTSSDIDDGDHEVHGAAYQGRTWEYENGESAPINAVRVGKLGEEEVLTAVDDLGLVRTWLTRDLTRPPIKLTNTISTWGVATNGPRTLVAVSANDHKVRLWDMGDHPVEPLEDYQHGPGFETAAARHTSTSQLHLDATGSLPLTGHTHNIPSVDISPCGSFVASGSIDGTVRIWNAQNGTCVSTARLGALNDWGWSVRFVPTSFATRFRVAHSNTQATLYGGEDATTTTTTPSHVPGAFPENDSDADSDTGLESSIADRGDGAYRPTEEAGAGGTEDGFTTDGDSIGRSETNPEEFLPGEGYDNGGGASEVPDYSYMEDGYSIADGDVTGTVRDYIAEADDSVDMEVISSGGSSHTDDESEHELWTDYEDTDEEEEGRIMSTSESFSPPHHTVPAEPQSHVNADNDSDGMSPYFLLHTTAHDLRLLSVPHLRTLAHLPRATRPAAGFTHGVSDFNDRLLSQFDRCCFLEPMPHVGACLVGSQRGRCAVVRVARDSGEGGQDDAVHRLVRECLLPQGGAETPRMPLLGVWVMWWPSEVDRAMEFYVVYMCDYMILIGVLVPVVYYDGTIFAYEVRRNFEQDHTLEERPIILRLPPNKIFEHMGEESVRPAVEAVLEKSLFDMAGRAGFANLDPMDWMPPYRGILTGAALAGALILTNDLKNVSIPDFDAVLDIPMLGDCDFIFRNGTLNWVSVDPTLTFVELTNNLLTGFIGNVSFEVEMDFRYTQRRWPHVKSHGHAIMHGLSGNITALTTFYIGDTGAVELFVLDSSTAFDLITVDVSDSKAAWLYNAVTGLFRQRVQGEVEAKLTEEVKNTLPNAANQLFDTMPRSFPVLGNPLNVSFVPPIYIAPTRAVAHIYGLFQTDAGPCPYAVFSPFTASEASAPLVPTRSRMLTFHLHQSVGQCFLWSLTQSGFLTRRIDQTTTPNAPTEILSTVTWAKVVPQVADVFGPDAPVSIETRPTRGEPRLHVSPDDGVVASIEGFRVAVFAFDDPNNVAEDAPRTLIFSFDISGMLAAAPRAGATTGQIEFGVELVDADVGASLVKADPRLGDIDMERVNLAFKAALGSASEQLQQLVDDNPIMVPRIPFVDIVAADALTEEAIVTLNLDIGYNGR